MIHDPQIEVTCDGLGCSESCHVDMHLVIDCREDGFFSFPDEAIEELLPAPWCTVSLATAGKMHYCSAECAENPE